MNKQQYLEYHAKMCEVMKDITAKKNADYTGGSDDPFANFRQIGALVSGKAGAIELGFLTRMSDKMSRIGSFLSRGELSVRDESVTDTLLDLANYCILLAGYLQSERMKPMQSPGDVTAGLGQYSDRLDPRLNPNSKY